MQLDHKVSVDITMESMRGETVYRVLGFINLKDHRLRFHIEHNPITHHLVLRAGPLDGIDRMIHSFNGRFFSIDYRNRKIINWIGKHAEKILEEILKNEDYY